MKIRRNAVLTALAAACALFIGLNAIARVPVLVALPIALLVGGAGLAALSRSSSATPIAPERPAVITPEPPPPQYHAQPVAGVPMPSAREDYVFVFSATVYWLPIVADVFDAGTLAVSDVIRRAREIARQRDPAQSGLVTHEVAGILREARPDPTNRVQVRAESVNLLLSDDDRRRLEELARLRKEEELWDYQRRHEQSKRRYLSEDVLKKPGSAVVWWLARNDTEPEKVADSIGALTRLANAANDAGEDPVDDAAAIDAEDLAAGPPEPQTPAQQFGAFLDSLNSLDDDARLLITKQMASMVESHGYASVASEMISRYDEWPGDADSGVSGDEPEPTEW